MFAGAIECQVICYDGKKDHQGDLFNILLLNGAQIEAEVSDFSSKTPEISRVLMWTLNIELLFKFIL